MSDAGAGAAPSGATRAGVLRLTSWLVALSLPAIVLHGVIADAAATASFVTNDVALSGRDYLALYVLAPIVAVSGSALFMAPGLLLTYLAGRASAVDRWLVSALAVSLVVVSAFAGAGQAALGASFRGAAFGWSLALLVVAIASAGWLVRRRGQPAMDAQARPAVMLAVLVPLLLAALFGPKLHWDSLNGDGVHAFESARLLLSSPLPFWPDEAGPIAGFPGVTSMLFAFPAAWYMRLFGAVDASARLPLLLYLPVLVSALGWMVSSGNRPSLRLDARFLVWFSVIVYAVAMSWSATYNPYSADVALPATQDTLLMVVFLGFLAAFVDQERWWAVMFAVLSYVSLPSGLMMIAFWMVAIGIAWRPTPWREVRWLAMLLVGLFIGGALLPRLIALLGLPTPGDEYGLVGILRYFAFLRFTDVARLTWVALPVGVVPVVAVAVWGQQDRVARALALVAVAYFLFFFVQANVSLHHFVPSMLLSVAVLWRVIPTDDAARRPWVLATALGALISLGLVIPGHVAPHLEGRRIGQSVWNRVEGYAQSDASTFAASWLLNRLFPFDWDPAVPSRYGGAPPTWHRYARTTDSSTVNYILQRADQDAPSGAHRLADSAGFALFVRSDSVLESDRSARPPTPAGSRWLAVPRWTLFRTVDPPPGTQVIDVIAVMKSLGLPVEALLGRLGVSP